MFKTEKITVDLGEFGTHELNFSESFDSSDLEKAMREQPARYDWYGSVHSRLKARLDSKTDFLKETIAKRRSDIQAKLSEERDKKVTQKELDSLVEKDAEVLTVKEEINNLAFQVHRVQGHLTSLSQFHSILKELSRRERASLLNLTDDEDMFEKAEKRVKGKRKSR